MKIYICADIEGIAGVVTFQHLSPDGFEYERAREWMTAEVAAAAEAALENGATEIVISDSHGNGQNLLMERLPRDCTLIRSWPRPLEMMQGIEEGSFGGVMLVGHHCGHTDGRGVLAHTFTGAFMEVRLNGEPASETRFNAAIAGHFNAPVLLATGDDAYVDHARALLGNIETVTTKWVVGDYCARTRMPAASVDLVRAAAARAMQRRHELTPYRIAEPVQLDIVYKQRLPAEVMGYMPGVERIGPTTIRFRAKNILEASRFIVVATSYKSDLR
jgi:D-amino peptidase